MEINEKLKDKLVGFLRTELPKIKLTEASGTLYVGDVFSLDKGFSTLLQSANSLVRAQIESYVGERPLMALVFGVLSKEIEQIPIEEKSGKKLLCDLPQYRDIEALAKRILEMLLALPHKYVIAMELPQSLTKALYEIKAEPILGGQLSVVGSWHENLEGLPVPQDPRKLKESAGALSSIFGINSKLLSDVPEEGLIRSYLYVNIEGFVDSVFSEHPLSRFEMLMKSFFGLAMALEVLEPDLISFNLAMGLGRRPIRFDVYAHREGTWEKQQDQPVKSSAGALIGKFRLHNGARRNVAADLRRIVRILDRSEELPRIVLAGRWYFDSMANGDDVMGFTQLAICAEILLGSEDGVDGVTAILASRCGYLIAKSAKERLDLILEFKSIYKVRSKIVHNGLGSLRESERQQFRRLRIICKRIIQKELELALADVLSLRPELVDTVIRYQRPTERPKYLVENEMKDPSSSSKSESESGGAPTQ